MKNRSSTFHYHVKQMIERAKKRGMSKGKIQKLVEIAERWEERRQHDREGQS
jgi:DNA-binding transcriptional regulator YhcF (GntR family)